MSDRPYINTPTAVRLREITAVRLSEMHASGLSWRGMGAVLGYHYSTVRNCAIGRNQAGPALARDVESMYAEWAREAV